MLAAPAGADGDAARSGLTCGDFDRMEALEERVARLEAVIAAMGSAQSAR